MKKISDWFLHPPVTGPSAILLLRLMAGGVFFWDGILKFVYIQQDAERFTDLTFPIPEITAHFITFAEITGGVLLILGLFTRIIAFCFILQMTVTVLSIKIDLYFGGDMLLSPMVQPKADILEVSQKIHAAYAQILTCLFLLIEGSGRRSIDFIISTSKKVYSISKQ